MQYRSTPGRRRAPKKPWHTQLRASLSPQIAVKSVAALGIVGAATASVVVPATESASASTTGLPAASSLVAEARLASVEQGSRSTARTALGERATTQGAATAGAEVVSPGNAAPIVSDTVGVTGIEAVAKPTPTPTPTPEPTKAPAAKSAAPAAAAPAGVDTTSYLGKCRGLGLGANAAAVCSAVQSAFGPMTIGGYRAGDSGDHGAGRAADIMVTGAKGDAIAAYLQANAGTLRIKYLIWKQRYWAPGGNWRWMADRGSPTQNHYDHVHVSVY